MAIQSKVHLGPACSEQTSVSIVPTAFALFTDLPKVERCPLSPSMTQAYSPHACCADSSRASTATTLRQLRLARRGHAANLPEQPARILGLAGLPKTGLELAVSACLCPSR